MAPNLEVDEFLEKVFAPTAHADLPAIRARQVAFVELYGGSFDDAAAASNRLWCGSSPDGNKIGFRFWLDADNSVVDLTLSTGTALALMKNIHNAAVIAGERLIAANATAGSA